MGFANRKAWPNGKPVKVRSLSGGELQRVAITVCLGTPAELYLIDEPSAGLDCEQRIIAAKVIKRWVSNHLGKTAFVIEHDFVMAAALSDRVIVYSGTPGVECRASAPNAVVEGFNTFLEQLQVTLRRDAENFRPRINKKNSQKDSQQKRAGAYFLFEEDADDDGPELPPEPERKKAPPEKSRQAARKAEKSGGGKGK